MKRLVRILGLLGFGCIGAAQGAVDHVVQVGGGSDTFSPSTLTINTGDTVTFTLVSGSHNVVSDTGLFRCANGCDASGGNGAPASNAWSVTLPFNSAGSYGYYCEPHGAPGVGMHGTIRVNAPAFSITPGISGFWYNKPTSGQGFDLQILANGVAAGTWYTFDNAGNSYWLAAAGTYSGDKATLNVNTVTGGFFPPNFPTDSTKIHKDPWGTLIFTFSDCNTGTAAWYPLVPGYYSGNMPITRLTSIGGATCP